MTLERWLSLGFLTFCLAYGYSAFWLMDATLPVFAKLSPVWPSSFPKILAVLGTVFALLQLVFPKASDDSDNKPDIDRSRLGQYQWRTVGSIVALMIGYALVLRLCGFVAATVLFLMLAAAALGERRWLHLAIVAGVSAIAVWYLVDPVLGIYLRPWPFFVYGGF